jgi:transcription elongation GreA/GreB family factor
MKSQDRASGPSTSAPSKRAIVEAAIAALEAELAALTRSAKETQAGATHEEARPESDKDTRATEASYLARGQAMRVEDTAEALTKLRFFPLSSYDESTPIGASATVRLRVYEPDGSEREGWYFLVPVAGGHRLQLAGTAVQLLNTASPLGRALLERYEGESFELRLAGKLKEVEIALVR